MAGEDTLLRYLREETLLTLRPRRYTLAAYFALVQALRLVLHLHPPMWVDVVLVLWYASTFPFDHLVRRRCGSPRALALLQLGYFLLELLFVSGAVYFSGVTRSFGAIYFLYTITYAGVLMERRLAIAVTAAAGLLYSGLVAGEAAGIIPRYPPLGLPPEMLSQPVFLGALLILTAGSTFWLIGYTVNRFAEHLRERERDLHVLSLRHEHLVSSRRRLEAELEAARRQAITDGLTGLHNHAHFMERLHAEIRRGGGAPLSLIFLDLDHFKSYNDDFGHPEGDRLLVGFAQIIRRSAREDDVAARYGGEEFALLLPRTGPEEAVRVAERIRLALEADASYRRRVTVSAGVAAYPHHAGSAEALLEKADRAVYAAKALGRNRVVTAGDTACECPPPAHENSGSAREPTAS